MLGILLVMVMIVLILYILPDRNRGAPPWGVPSKGRHLPGGMPKPSTTS